MNKKATELAERLQKHFAGPMTEEEISFLRDAQSFIEFAIRNGLSFALVASTVGHDMNELARDLFDLQQAKARGFHPKVAGYSQVSEDDFGGAEEPLD
jgi:predicted HD phosphohydrolase